MAFHVPQGMMANVNSQQGAWMSAIYRFRPDAGCASLAGADLSFDSSPRLVEKEAVELRFAKTELGEAELQHPVHDLPRPARELLFMVDRWVAIEQSVSEVHDTQLADAMLLLNMGLIRTTSFDGNSASRAVRPLIDALLSLSSDDLYTLLTQQAKRRLGLLHGFRMVLALERCNDHHERCAIAVRFVQEIWRTHGEAGIQPLRRLLKA